MPLLQTSGNVTTDGYGGGVAAVPNYIEDVFSTYLYTGNNGSQTITNNIDLSTKGGMVWIKNRQTAADHDVTDTARGAKNPLFTNRTYAQDTNVDYAVNSFLTTGFTLNSSDVLVNALNQTYVSWTFRKQPKFFDVVTWTGNGSAITVNHNLGSVPGCIIIKAFSSSPSTGQNWLVYHRSVVNQGRLNSTDAFIYSGIDNVTSTSFEPSGTGSGYNVSGVQYIGYVFAHNAGGFGLTGTDNVISCGSFTAGSNSAAGSATINLGYEPQWILTKNATGTSTASWQIYDNMRGCTAANPPSYPISNALNPNNSNAESDSGQYSFNSTGFVSHGGYTNGDTIIYIAIRRGPMKVPTSGTSVFAPVTYTGNGSSQSLTAGFPIDLSLFKYRGGATNSFEWFDRLRGTSPDLRSAYTYAELATTTEVTSFASNTQVTVGASSDTGGTNASGQTYVLEAFRRAPSFFDEVCYTGTGVARTLNHNLGAVPELMIVKRRDGTSYGDWLVYHASLGNTKYLLLNTSDASATANSGAWNFTNPTSTQFTVGDWESLNATATYVAYLFATCAGVSKVGSYTGNGTTQTINCGFTGGARFVLIKRTDSTGDWYVYDTARGMTVLTDPYLLLNSTAAESATLGSVTTVSTGFAVNASILAAINTNGASYIFLAIA